MMTIARVLIFLIALAGIAAIPGENAWADAKELPFKIDALTARRLVLEAIGQNASHLLSNDGDPMEIYDNQGNLVRTVEGMSTSPPFFTFTGISPPPAEGSFGFYAVNPWTGDVWELRDCRRLSTPALRRSQAEIRKRFTPEERRRYAQLRHRLRVRCV
jgi:hypothetical protein